MTALLCSASAAQAQTVGAAQSFAVEGAAAVTAAGGAGTVISGDVGSTNTSPTSITGFPPAVVTPGFGLHFNDAQAIAAQAAATSLFTQLNAGACADTDAAPQMSGANFGPGIHCFSSTADLAATGVLTLTGTSTDVFIFRVGSSLTANVLSTVLLNGVNACNVYWRVTSAATLNGINFPGNVVASAGVTLGVGANLTGRALAIAGPVTMAGNNTVGGCSSGSVSLVKQATPTTFQNVNAAISYSYLVTNTGASTLTGPVTVADDKASVTCPVVANLLPGASVTCTATYLATAADVTAGLIVNHATAVVGSATSNPATTTVAKTEQTASIALLKLTNGSDHNTGAGLLVTTGSTLTFTYLVTNTGNVALDVALFDIPLGVIAGADCVPNTTTLAPGQSMLCTKTEIALAGGPHCNDATATGTPAGGLAVTAENSECYTGQPPATGTGGLTITKNSIGGNDTFSFNGSLGPFDIGTVTNTGTQTFSNLAPGTYTITEDPKPGWTLTSSTCASVTVSANAVATCTVVNTKVPATGTLVVFKTTIGGNGSFSFKGGLGYFSISTAANTGTKVFSSLTPGTYSITENSKSGWAQTSSTCGSVTVSAGLVSTCTVVNTKVPVCEYTPPTVSLWKTIVGPPKQVVLLAQDAGGIRSIVVTTWTNLASVTFSLSPTGSPTFSVFPPGGITAPVYIFATKANQNAGSVIGVTVTDLCGNVTVYDPIDTTVNPGRHEAVTLTGVSDDETLVQIINDNLNAMRITVNGRQLPTVQLRRYESRTIDISRAMLPGDNNVITLEAQGPNGSSAFVTVYPPPATSADEATARKRRDRSHQTVTFFDRH